MKKIVFTIILCLCIFFTGCFRHQHTVGSGPHVGTEYTEHQWYALWGLVRINTPVNEGLLVEAEDYRITTKFSGWDCLLNFFIGPFSFYRRTIDVEK
ncbi:MAG: hypothetical protein KBC30_02995 [Planctomycetes bacterium]|jgi:hypothetical protein|nr:hypothetical protein [Planctomycetota bacterium]HPY74243.1 hypothetical protein [Planctomycetota bacterium]HQB00071.1 hypothetical protein [Planctomycetota bacterium]HRU51285.1 hypothetical protein [Planctomycetota bacterium]